MKLAAFQVQRDVAAIVDVGAVKVRRAGHRRQNFFCHRAGDGRHGCNEPAFGIGCHGRRHSLCDGSVQVRSTRAGLGSQIRQLRAKFVEHRNESASGCLIGSFDLEGRAKCLEDEVDRTVVQEESASIREQVNLCAVHG